MASHTPWLRRTALSRRALVRGASAGGVGLAGLGLVGCGDDDDKPAATASNSPASASAAPASPTTAPSPTPVPTRADLAKLTDDEFFKAIPSFPTKDWKDADIKTGGKAIRASNRPAAHFDFATTVTGFIWDPTATIYNRLLRLNAGQGIKGPIAPETEPDLAEKWERPDPSTLIFTLAPNIKFQDVAPLNGRALAVSDINFAITRLKTLQTSIYKAQAAMFDTAEAVGANQMRLKLNGPQLTAENILALPWMGVMPPEIGENPDTPKTKAVGTGSMIMDSVTPNVAIEFRKNPGYFKKDAQGRQKPYMDGYTLQYILDTTQVASQFAAGRVDFCWSETSVIGSAPFDQVRDFYKRTPNAMLQLAPNVGSSSVIFGQWTHPAYKDERFRRALNMLMPREALLKNLFKGYGNVAPYFPWPVLFESQPTIKDLGPYFQYNPAEAKKMLEAAGLLANAYDLEWYEGGAIKDVVAVLQDEAAKIGLKLNLVKNADQATHFGNALQKKFKDLSIYGRGLDFVDPAATVVSYVKGQGRNIYGVEDPAIDDLYTKLQTATGDARKAVSKQIFERQLDQVYEIPIPVASQLGAWHPRLKNWVDGVAWSSRSFGLGQVDSIWIDPNAKL